MNENQQLRESMWDLVYGLVSPEEERQLVDRIKSDPDVARLYAEVRLEADLVGQAAKVADSSLVLKASEVSVVSAQSGKKPERSSQRATAAGGKWQDSPRWLWAGATALLALLGVGLLWPTAPTGLLDNMVAIDVLSSPALPAGLSRKVELRTYLASTDGQWKEADADVELRLVSADGRELLRQQVLTDRRGHATVELPGTAIEPGAKVEVRSAGQTPLIAANSVVVAELPVQPEPQVAYFLAAEPTVAEGKPVEVSLWNFAAFSAKPTPAGEARAAMEEVEGLKVTESLSNEPLPGVLNARVEVPEQAQSQATAGLAKAQELAPGQQAKSATLAQEAKREASALERQIAQRSELNFQRRAVSQNRSFAANAQLADSQARGGSQNATAGGEAPTIAAGQPIRLPLSAEMAAKEIVATASCRGAPVATTVHTPPTTSLAADDKRDKQQAESAEIVLNLPPEADGLIEVSLYDRTHQEPVLLEQRQLYREPLQQLKIEVAQGKDRYTPGEQVDLQLRVTDEAGRPAANTRLGVRVWNERSVQQAEEPPVLLAEAVRNNYLAVAPESWERGLNRGPASFDRAGRSANAYQQQNRPRGESQLASGGLPGGKAGADQAKPNEAARNKPATDQSAAALADRVSTPQPASPTEADSLSAINVPAPVERFAIIEESRSQLAAESASVAESIELASNRDAVRAVVDAAVTTAQSQRRTRQAVIGTIVVVGGCVLLLVMAMAAMRHAIQRSVLVPLGAVGGVCTFVGMIWLGGATLRERGSWALASRTTTATAENRTIELVVDEANVDLPGAAASSPTTALSPESASSPEPALASPPASRPEGLAARPPADPSSAPQDPSGRAELPASTDLARGTALSERSSPGRSPAVPAVAAGGYGSAAPPASVDAASPAPLAGSRARTATTMRSPSAAPALAATLPSEPVAERAALTAGRAASLRENEDAAAAPAAIYFNPQLMTDAEGKANIQLVMPRVESEYRLLIDALGQGRVGSRQDQLIIDNPPAGPPPPGAK